MMTVDLFKTIMGVANGSLLEHNNEYISIDEAFKLTPINQIQFGSDKESSNKEWVKTLHDNSMLATSLNAGEWTFVLAIDSSNIILFGTIPTSEYIKTGIDNKIMVRLAPYFKKERKLETHIFAKYFSQLTSIFIDYMIKHKVNKLSFDAFNSKLESFYKMVTQSKEIQQKLGEEGYSIYRNQDGKFEVVKDKD